MNTNVIAFGTANEEATKAVGADVKKVLEIAQGGDPTPDWLKDKSLAEQQAYWDRCHVATMAGKRALAEIRKKERENKAAERAAEKQRKIDEQAAARTASLGNNGSCFFFYLRSRVMPHILTFSRLNV